MICLKKTLKGCIIAAVLGSTAPASIGLAYADTLDDARKEGAAAMALALNSRLGSTPIHLKLTANRVILTGAVESEEDKTLAGQLAQAVSGATQVDNQLTLDPALAERPPVKPPQQIQLDDLTLAAVIRGRFAWNTDTADSDLDVSVDGGVVTLKGQAATAQAKEWAGVLATDTDGAIVVNNLISLRAADTGTTQAQAQARSTDTAVSDAWIASKVVSSFQYDRSLDALRLDVKVKTGLVSLTGEVDSSASKNRAMEVARRLRGVRGVDGDLLKIAVPIQP
jgi:osmotically-inducible protein OsmY